MAIMIAKEDRKIVVGIAAAFVLAMALVAFLLKSDPAGSAFPSSYGSGAGGGKAAFLLLQMTGYNAQRFNDNPRALEKFPSTTTLVLADPIPEDSADIASVQQFVEKGGRVLGTGEGVAIFVKGRHIVPHLPHFDWKSYAPQEPSDLTRGIQHIEMTPFFNFNSEEEAPFKEGEEIPVTRVRYGKGEFIWWSSSSALTNEGVGRSDNVQLLLNSVGDPHGRTVLWDEYFHEGAKTVFDSFIDSPLRWGLVETAVIMMLICFTWSRRFAPLQPLVPVSRLATMDFVETLAELYKNAKAGNVAVEVVYQRFRARAQQRFYISRKAPVRDVAPAIAHRVSGSSASSIAELLEKAEQGISEDSLSADKATEMIQGLHRLSRDLGLLGEKQAWKH